MKKAEIYTDGSYNKELQVYGCGAVIILEHRKPIRMHKTGKPEKGQNGWNINGEIEAALMAIEKAISLSCDDIVIYHDYEGVGKWPNGQWKTNKDFTKKYAAKIQEYRKKTKISFVHVKGHSGNMWNEMADEEAKIGACLSQAPIPKAQQSIKNPVESNSAVGSMPKLDKEAEIASDGLTEIGRKSLEKFFEKKERSFRDYVSLKTGGKDAYSIMSVKEMEEELGKRACRIIKGSVKNEAGYITALRWAMRGLRTEDAAKKANIDQEIHASKVGKE